jgi:hypothetical protein
MCCSVELKKRACAGMRYAGGMEEVEHGARSSAATRRNALENIVYIWWPCRGIAKLPS